MLPCFCFRLLNTNYTCCSCEPNISIFSRVLLDQVSSRFFMELLMVSILVYPSRNFFFISAAKGLMHRASVGAPPHKNLYSHIASFQRLYPTPLSPTHHPSSLSLPPGKQKYTCPKCNMQYLMLTVLERHMAKCDGTNPWYVLSASEHSARPVLLKSTCVVSMALERRLPVNIAERPLNTRHHSIPISVRKSKNSGRWRKRNSLMVFEEYSAVMDYIHGYTCDLPSPKQDRSSVYSFSCYCRKEI